MIEFILHFDAELGLFLIESTRSGRGRGLPGRSLDAEYTRPLRRTEMLVLDWFSGFIVDLSECVDPLVLGSRLGITTTRTPGWLGIEGDVSRE